MFENVGNFPCFDISLLINPNFACNENDDGEITEEAIGCKQRWVCKVREWERIERGGAPNNWNNNWIMTCDRMCDCHSIDIKSLHIICNEYLKRSKHKHI